MSSRRQYNQGEAKNFMINTNNRVIDWLDDIESTNANPPVFGEGRLSGSNNTVFVRSSTFTDATERMRNVVKEKSTQADQLGTAFQTRNSRFNAMIEAMTNFTKTYFGAVKNFVS